MCIYIYTWGAGSLLRQVSVVCAWSKRCFLQEKSNIDANACEENDGGHEKEDGGDNDDNDDTDDEELNL